MRSHSLTIIVVLLAAASAAGGRGQDLFTDDDRFYLAPIIGASWATVVNAEYQPVNAPIQTAGSLFSAGGAAGIAFDRDSGQVRLEFEGRYRDSYSVASTRFVGPIPLTADVELVDNWSTLVNVWRDFSITKRLGLYGGGGIGAGGYGLSTGVTVDTLPPIAQGSSRHTAFAWQVGTGVLYALNDRITLDLGYRFYSVGLGTTAIKSTGIVPPDILPPDASLPVTTGFASNELLLNIRIYEPFRRWR
jgi:opacity protein-like surface antigen